MNVTVFEAINITKKYRNTLALNQVSMSVMQGDIYGFIGENGAGKTTMIRLLTGLAEPTTGKIALFGESNKKLAKQRERIGCIIESPSLYLDMTAYENLEVQRLQRGIPGKGCIDNALALVGLKDTGKKKAKDFSLGMRQRLALAIALLGNPEFLVLDEPINGLDPTGIIELRNLLKRLNKERGITILISSHILTELHQLANRYGILHEGKLLQEITATELDKRCKKHLLLQVNDVAAASVLLESKLNTSNFSVMPDKIQFIIASPAHLPEHDWLDEKVFEVKKIVTTLKNNMSQIIKPYLQEDVQKIWTTGFEDKVLYTEKEYEECVNTLKSNAATVHKTSCFCDMAK